jgi:hypothetical protein
MVIAAVIHKTSLSAEFAGRCGIERLSDGHFHNE